MMMKKSGTFGKNKRCDKININSQLIFAKEDV
jgi:hypothetical protein